MNEMDARAGRPEGKTIKRFYREATVGEDGGLWRVLLDGKPMRTPAKAMLAVPSKPLAEAIAAEWAAQGDTIAPATMHLTRFANTAIDRVQGREANVLDDILAYAASDLVLYRADAPDGLRTRQDAAWNTPLDWARSSLQAEFTPVEGVIHVQQPAASIARLGEFLAPFDTFALTALHIMTTMTGSALLAAAHADGAMDLDAVWAAAHVDEDWQIEKWGEDEEAVARAVNVGGVRCRPPPSFSTSPPPDRSDGKSWIAGVKPGNDRVRVRRLGAGHVQPDMLCGWRDWR